MKTKILNKAHYNYANEICKIIGFTNISDYTVQISYTTLKNNSLTIAININKTFDQFKKLFELKYFNLSRLNYKIETITQIWAFIKKLFKYMNISFDIIRINKDIKMRLINQNNLHIEYINKMSNNEQNNNIVSEKQPTILFSTILEKYKMKSYEKTYYVKSHLNLKKLITDFEYFNHIQIININYPIHIEYIIGGTTFYKENFNNIDNKNYKFIINFPNNKFFCYQEPTIKFINPENANSIFKIIVNGFKFKSTIINYDKYTIKFDHEQKYLLFDYANVYSCGGMIGKKYSDDITKEELDFYIKNKKQEKINKLISYETYINKLITDKLITETEFNFNKLKLNLITIYDCNILEKFIYPADSLALYPNFNSNGNSLQLSSIIYDDYMICLIQNYILPFEYSIVNDDNTVSNYYQISPAGDLLKSIKIFNKCEFCNNEKVKIEIMCEEKIHIGIFNNNTLFEQIDFKNFYNLLKCVSKNIYLIITIDEKYFNNFEKLNINLGRVFANTDFRKNLVSKYPLII